MFRCLAIRAVQTRHQKRVDGLASAGCGIGFPPHSEQYSNTSIVMAAVAKIGSWVGKFCPTPRRMAQQRRSTGEVCRERRASRLTQAWDPAPNSS